MRINILLVSLSLCGAPAAAQSVAAPAPAETKAIAVPPEFRGPAGAEKLADTMQSLSQALLEMKVGGLQAALDGRKPTRAERNLTVRDLARRDDPQFDRHLQERIVAARPMIEQGVKAFNEALPAITQSLAEAQKSVERAIANMPDPNYPKR